jgi:hypothetical protein
MFNIEHIPHGKNALEVLADNAFAIEDMIEEYDAQTEAKAVAEAQAKNSDIAYINADFDPVKDLLMSRLNYANDRLKLADLVQKDLELELENHLDNSILKLAPDAKLDYDSVAKWAKENYGIGRFDYEDLKFIGEPESKGDAKITAIDFSNNGMLKLQAKRYLITMAYLIEKLIESDTKYGTVDEPNVSAIARVVCDAFHSDKESSKGYEDRSVRDRISTALAMKQQFGEINP